MTTYIANNNPKTKKDFKELATKKKLMALQMGLSDEIVSGPASVVISGPRFPQAHKWYAKCKVGEDGFIIPESIK